MDFARQAKGWLDHCISTHSTRCPATLQRLPKRIIAVGDTSDDPCIYEADPDETGVYACLSYCWGKTRTFTTTLATLEDRKKGFSIEELPSTIRDAVLIARGMGLRFLWVDSLCIIQDSLMDWECESAKMCSIYSNSTVTFAAVDSPGSDSGLCTAGPGRRLFKLGNRERSIYARKRYHALPGALSDGEWPDSHTLRKNALHDRGWTLQEVILSPRVLWFKSTELCWSCSCETACECHPDPVPDLMDSYPGEVNALSTLLCKLSFLDVVPLSQSGWVDAWSELVWVFMRRQLTKLSDRLSAISGLAEQFLQRLGVRYLCGMWETRSLHKQLLWLMDVSGLESPKETPEGLAPDYAPSWSWASVSGPVFIPRIAEDNNRDQDNGDSQETLNNTRTEENASEPVSKYNWHHTVEHGRLWNIEALDFSLSTSNPFGPGRGTITLESLLVPLEYCRDPSAVIYRRDKVNSSSIPDVPLFLLEVGPSSAHFKRDWRHDWEAGTGSYARRDLWFIFATVDPQRHEEFEGLVVERLDEGDRFRRLGLGHNSFLQEGEGQNGILPHYRLTGLFYGTWELWERLGKRETIKLV